MFLALTFAFFASFAGPKLYAFPEPRPHPHIAPNPGLHYTGRQATAVRSCTMNDSINDNVPVRPIERWLGNYSGDHLNRTNQRIHLLCVPAIVWTVIAALWAIPVRPAEHTSELQSIMRIQYSVF